MKGLVMCAVALVMIACSDGGGGNGTGAPGYTHNELAAKFVLDLNMQEGFEVSLAKDSTLKKNFVVIYDKTNDSYDAISIANYNPALDNAADFYANQESTIHYDLDVIPGYTEAYDYQEEDSDGNLYWVEDTRWVDTAYRDRHANISFEKISATPKDLAKMSALIQEVKIQKTAQAMTADLGLSMGRAVEVAKLHMHWNKASIKSMTNNEVDSFSTELLGFSMTKGMAAVKSAFAGNESELNALINLSANTNGITPEHAKKLMTKVFGL